ncbi:MAG: hypothetical protein ACI9XP_001163 [Lentimonas sp.]|jgi:hypothetical protein
MCKNSILLFFAFLFTLCCKAQNWEIKKPNYDKIHKTINQSRSSYNYRKLMDRYQDGDTTLSIKEKRLVYYGFIFQPEYAPNETTSLEDTLQKIMKVENHTDEQLWQIVRIGNKILEENPFDLNVIDVQVYAYNALDEKSKARHRIDQLFIVVDAMMSSGDGTSLKHSFYIIEQSHQLTLMNILGFIPDGKPKRIRTCDYQKINQNDYNVEGLYFDLSPTLDSAEAKN